jgi:hypothetical protein
LPNEVRAVDGTKVPVNRFAKDVSGLYRTEAALQLLKGGS